MEFQRGRLRVKVTAQPPTWRLVGWGVLAVLALVMPPHDLWLVAACIGGWIMHEAASDD